MRHGPRFFWKNSLAVDHIVAASKLTARAEGLEAQYGDRVPLALFSEHRALVLGAVGSAVAYLEACINEIFANCENGYNSDLRLGQRQTKTLETIWQIPQCNRLPVLSKYNLALAALTKPVLLKDEEEFQGANLLIRLRNRLLHFEPSWAESVEEDREPEGSEPLVRALKGRFKINPFREHCELDFPDLYLSAGCAAWATIAAVTFTDSFFERLKRRPRSLSGVRCT